MPDQFAESKRSFLNQLKEATAKAQAPRKAKEKLEAKIFWENVIFPKVLKVAESGETSITINFDDIGIFETWQHIQYEVFVAFLRSEEIKFEARMESIFTIDWS